MPLLKPCLKSKARASPSGAYTPPTNHPPIPSAKDAILLKSSSDYSDLPYAHPFVHFPPSPVLTSTYAVDPPRLYDRTPIVVSENACALPQRGCPGRTYDDDGEGSNSSHHGTGNHMHPSAMKFTGLSPGMGGFYLPPSSSRQLPVPGLMLDEGSSEESDGLVSPPPEAYNQLGMSPHCHSLCTPDYHSTLCPAVIRGNSNGRRVRGGDIPNPSMFLPHPPSPRSSRSFSSTYESYESSPSPSRSPSSHMTNPPPRKCRPRAAAPSFTSSWDNNSSCLGGF